MVVVLLFCCYFLCFCFCCCFGCCDCGFCESACRCACSFSSLFYLSVLYYLRQKNGTRYENSKNSKRFLKNSDYSNFDAQRRAEFGKIGPVTLRLAIFEQYRLFHRFWAYNWHEKNTLPFSKSFPIFISL